MPPDARTLTESSSTVLAAVGHGARVAAQVVAECELTLVPLATDVTLEHLLRGVRELVEVQRVFPREQFPAYFARQLEPFMFGLSVSFQRVLVGED